MAMTGLETKLISHGDPSFPAARGRRRYILSLLWLLIFPLLFFVDPILFIYSKEPDRGQVA